MSPRDGAVAVGGQSGISRRYDLARDGGVIAVLERDQQEASEPPHTIIVLNWFEELKQRSR